MITDWSRAVDVDRLADAQALQAFDLALAEFPRLRAQLLSQEGQAQGRVVFRRERGVVVAALQVAATLTLQCQRCMQAVQWPVTAEAQLALVDDPDSADALADEYEPVLAPGGRVLLRDLVEEELLLALPLVPRHEDVHCVDAQIAASSAKPDVSLDVTGAHSVETTQTPFAELGELLKRR